MTVRQTPRHVALGVLQKRLENFERLQMEAFAQSAQEEAPPQRAGRGLFDTPLQWEAPEAGNAASGMPQAHADAQPQAQLQAHTSAQPPANAVAQARAVQATPAATPPATIPHAPAAPGNAGAPGHALTPQQAAEVAAAALDPAAPPSPYDPAYDFKKDPAASQGGRFTAWNRYWKERRAREQLAAEEAAALANPPPNMRIGPGKTVPVRMEPGYNPPWLRDNRPQFAIGAGECWMD